MTDLRRRAARVLELESEAILALVARLDESFDDAVARLERCRGRVIVTGMGKSGIIARKIAATLASTGTPAHFLHPAEGVHGDLGMVARGDVVVVLSNSGETDEILAIVPLLKRLDVPIVLLTGNVTSALARQCDVVIDVSVREEACPVSLAPTSSTTAALAMGDALAMALLDLRGLRPEDFAALHPRGALGWRASVRVADLMRSGDAVPVVSDGALLKDVIAEMTQKSLGMTTVVDAAGRLVGVITDGDLRRLHLRAGPIGEFTARDFMTDQPKLIEKDALAATALDVMEGSGPITSLVIVDEALRPVGVVHLHDILRAKIDI
jgi:arabinose-5-phosphate isomerase